jgi:adenylate kinase
VKKMLAEWPDLPLFSTGERLRELVARPTNDPRILDFKAEMERGGTAPTWLIPMLAGEFLDSLDAATDVPIFDGITRSPEDVEAFHSAFDRFERIHMFLLRADPATVRARIATRRASMIAAGLSPRADDEPEVVDNRLRGYFAKAHCTYVNFASFVPHARVHFVNADDRTPDEVFSSVRASLADVLSSRS